MTLDLWHPNILEVEAFRLFPAYFQPGPVLQMNSSRIQPISFPVRTAAASRRQPGPDREWPLLRASLRRLALVMGCSIMLAACGSIGALRGSGADYSRAASLSSQGPLRSPASERVVSGIVEMVLSDQLVDDFEQARSHRRSLVSDGQPLYLYLRSRRPLGELAHPVDPYSKHSFSAYPHLFVQIGDNQSMRILNTCYVTLSAAEAKGHTLVVPLAPLTRREGDVPSDCWLMTMTQAEPFRQTFEVRLAGFPGRFESWLPVPDLLAVEAVEADLSRGAAAYAGMLRAEPASAPAGGLKSGRPAVPPAKGVPEVRGQAPAAAGKAAKESLKGSAREPATGRTAPAAEPRHESGSSTASRAAAAGAGTTLASVSAAAGAGASAAAAGVAGTVSAPKAARATAPVRAATWPAGNAGAAGKPMTRAEGLKPVATPAASSQAAAAPDGQVPARRTAVPASSWPAGARLLPLTPLLPAQAQYAGSKRMAAQLLSLSSTLLGRQPSKTYFAGRRWQNLPRQKGLGEARQTIKAIAVFRGEVCSWQPLLVSRRAGSGTISEVMIDGDEVTVDCLTLDAS